MIGTRLGPWLLESEIGRGGMATVFLAHADALPEGEPRVAAVKVLAAELAAEQGFVLRFEREIDILRRLDHPNIVRFFESGVSEGRPWFAMEYVDGPSFDAVLEQRGRLAWREVLNLACQIAPALKHAHDRGVIHRDLKPSNLLQEGASGEGRGASKEASSPLAPRLSPLAPFTIKLTDFGVASLFASRHLTVTGGVVGTAEFLSPEQAAGKPVTRRSDLYSLGVVLYALLIGHPPFEGEVLDLLHKHRFGQFDAPIRLVPDLTPDFNAVICDLMAKEPDKRPADAGVLARRLEAIKHKVERLDAAATTAPTREYAFGGATDEAEANRAGPATVMSKLMRAELDRQNQGGPIQRWLNQPWVLLTLLAVVIGVIIWSFWPLGEEQLYQRGAAAAASANPDDWDKAREDFDALDHNHPNHAHKAEVEAFRQRLADHDAARQAERLARTAKPMSEAQWFFQEGLRQRQRGDEEGARRTWRALALAFGHTPSEEPWVRLAEKESSDANSLAERSWVPVREAVKTAEKLRNDGKGKEADAILQGLHDLYHNDPAAEKIIKE